MAISAYQKYGHLTDRRRELHICGDGPLRAALEEEVARRRIDGVRFCGILQPELIPSKLARSLALILPSTEEQWGLVANEAIAMGLPLLLSENCGAADSLLQTAVNGFLYEPDNPDGLAFFMNLLGQNEELWRRICKASTALRPLANSDRFQVGVSAIVGRLRPLGSP